MKQVFRFLNWLATKYFIFHIGEHTVKICILWYDLWIGIYVDRANKAVYFCPLPTLVIKIWKEEKREYFN